MSPNRHIKILIFLLFLATTQWSYGIDSLRLRKLELVSKVWGITVFKTEKKIKHPDKELLNLIIDSKKEVSFADFQLKVLTWSKKNFKLTSKECCKCNETILLPSFVWIKDTTLLGQELSKYIQKQVSKHTSSMPQYKLASTIPVFYDDKTNKRSELTLSNSEYIVAAIKYWNLVNYFYPYASDQNISWERTLPNIISEFDTITSFQSYYYSLLHASKRLKDGHARIYSSWAANTLFKYEIPFNVEIYEHYAIVTQVDSSTKNIEIGDRIIAIDSISIEDGLKHWDTLLSYSTRGWFLHTVRNYLFASSDSIVKLTIQRGENEFQKEISLVLSSNKPIASSNTIYNLNKDSIGYIHLGNLQLSHIPSLKRDLQKAKVLIIDARAYPNSTLIALSSWLLDERKVFARFNIPSKECFGRLENDSSITVINEFPIYQGTILFVIDRSTISQGEFMAMAFAQSSNVITIGRPTAGAVGTTSLFSLPGNVNCRITASKCMSPDGSQIQQKGVYPSINLTESTDVSVSDDLIKFAYEYASRLLLNTKHN